MIKLHIISDLYLGHTQHADPIEYSIPAGVNLIIINGNLGSGKRSMFHAEAIAHKYPNIPIVYNLGQSEKYNEIPKLANEVENGLLNRRQHNIGWPKNIYYSIDNIELTLEGGSQVDILCTYGFPKIHSYTGVWEDTEWFKNYVADVTLDHTDPRVDKIKGVTNTCRGYIPVWATMDWINEQHFREEAKVKKWELNQTSYKILVTHINPYNDIRLKNQIVSHYQIHLNNMLWVTSNQKIENLKFSGARLVSNPGLGEEARSHVVTID